MRAITTTAVENNVTYQAVLKEIITLVSATTFLALCARVSVPLLFSPVPLSLQNFGVLLIGLLLGPRRAIAAAAMYLLEGAAGLPVFAPTGPGGVLQLLGPTGGFLMSYPIVAGVAGMIFEKLGKSAKSAVIGSLVGEGFLFLCGLSWFLVFNRVSLGAAMMMTVLPFLPGEVLKVAAASAISTSWQRWLRRS